MNTLLLGACASLPLLLGLAGCSASTDPSEEAAAGGEALAAIGPSRHPEQCPGGGWDNHVASWAGLRGSFLRVGLAPSGELSSLDTLEDPLLADHQAPAYQRFVDGTLDTGRVITGANMIDLGGELVFSKDTLDADGSRKDAYWVESQRRGFTGAITAICLKKIANADGVTLEGTTPFMLVRIGF
jgi:hypothetical protein